MKGTKKPESGTMRIPDPNKRQWEDRPEHISSILERVMDDLKKKWVENNGGRSSDLSGVTLSASGPATLSRVGSYRNKRVARP